MPLSPTPRPFYPSHVRVALVSRELLPYWGAGIGAYAASMARAWAAAGHEVHLLTADHESLRAEGLKKAAGRFPGVTLHVCGALQSESDRESCVMPVHKRAMTVYS